ncbi:MAG: hypothetical protein KatS3mg131_2799 [Candidatus Tectimicrobiota bacterium]|nr:MAG: hypothetical protein KatS3mg131_2799 [Candidatus Tectomicrobia bacterium]
MSETPTRTPWRLKVHNLEACNCSNGCGCQFNGFPDYGGCEAIIGYEVIAGHYGNVDLSGVRAVFAGKWPGAIHEGHGQGVLFIDAAARPEQVEGLAKIFSGQAGGMPWEALAATLDTVEGPLLKPIAMTVDGRRSHFAIAGVLEVAMTSLINPVSGEESEVHIVYPKGGFLWNDGDVGTTSTMRIDHGALRFQYPGKWAAYAVAEWSNQG